MNCNQWLEIRAMSERPKKCMSQVEQQFLFLCLLKSGFFVHIGISFQNKHAIMTNLLFILPQTFNLFLSKANAFIAGDVENNLRTTKMHF